MNKTTMTLVAALPLLALNCKKASDNPEAVTKFTSFRDRACACKDAECAAKVAMDMKTWIGEFQKSEASKKQISDEDQKKVSAITEEMKQCMAKTIAAGHGSAAAAGGVEPGSAAPPAGSAEPATGSAAEPPPAAEGGSAN
jgi:hypothetical protein